MRKATAHEILSQHDEHVLWARFLRSKDEHIGLQALIYLTTQRDGRAYQQINPLQAQRLSAGDDPKLATVLRNLLPQPGSAEVTVTEKQTRIRPIQALENKAIEAERETPQHALLGAPENTITLDASAASKLDPSGRKAGVGHSGAESHTECNQDSEETC